jgi:hypothetical protein
MVICDNFTQAVGHCLKLIDAWGDDDAQLVPLQSGGNLELCWNCYVALHEGDGGRRVEYDANHRVRIVTRLSDA